MGAFVWIVIASLMSTSTEVSGLQITPGVNTLTKSQAERYESMRSAEMNLQNNRGSRQFTLSEAAQEVDSKDCKHLDFPGTLLRPLKIQMVKSRDFSFFFRPKENFGKLIIQPRMKNVFDVEEKDLEIRSSDLKYPETEWMEARVQYFQHDVSWAPNTHEFRITVRDTTKTAIAKHWSFLYSYEGFLLSAVGGLEVLFDCSPEDYFEEEVPSSAWAWLLLGCLISLMLVMVAMCCILVHRKRLLQDQGDLSSAQQSSQVYEEFDEDMLERIRQKVEALREGRKGGNSDSEIDKNHLVIQMTPLKDSSSTVDTMKAGEEATDEDRYQMPKNSKRERFGQTGSLRQKYDEISPVENNYEIMYPIGRFSHGARQDPATKVVSKTHSHPFSSYENDYETIYPLGYSTAPTHGGVLKDKCKRNAALTRKSYAFSGYENHCSTSEDNIYEHLSTTEPR